MALTPKQARFVKICPKCLRDDRVFGANKARADGHQTYCRDCMAALRAEKQYDKARWADQRESESTRNREYRQANAERLKASDRAKAAKRRAEHPGVIRSANIARKHGEKRATPVWADRDALNAVYAEAKRLEAADGVARHVDHVVPLKHPLVCGLHVPANLGILTARDNMQKHNTFQVGA